MEQKVRDPGIKPVNPGIGLVETIFGSTFIVSLTLA
jgi:hypothetical protein